MNPCPSTAALCALGLGAAAIGQSINIDFGSLDTAPPADYAGAGVPGVWNVIVGGTTQQLPVVGLDGEPTAVSIALLPGPEQFSIDDPNTTGGDELLLDDIHPGLGDVVCLMTFEGLKSGQYEVITYGWYPTQPDEGTAIWIDSVFDVGQTVGGPWPGKLQLGVTHALHQVEITNGQMTIESVGQPWGDAGAINGVQIIRTQPLAADLNDDGAVNVDDLITLIQHWTGDGHGCDGVKPCIGDINHDLFVQVDDLLLLFEAWNP